MSFMDGSAGVALYTANVDHDSYHLLWLFLLAWAAFAVTGASVWLARASTKAIRTPGESSGLGLWLLIWASGFGALAVVLAVCAAGEAAGYLR
jgi:hypothetical protein